MLKVSAMGFSKLQSRFTTVSSILRRFSIPKRQVGNYVYVPKVLIDKILQK